MAHTTEYKKTHLMDKHKGELETIAASFSAPTESETASTDTLENKLTDAIRNTIIAAYDENAKIVKGCRIDKDEFKETAIEKIIERAISEQITAQDEIKALTLSVMP